MIATQDLKPKIMRLWGNPSTDELSPQAMRDAIERVWNIITLETSMISPAFSAKFSPSFSLNAADWSSVIPISDIAVPVALEMRNSGQTEEFSWMQVETASIETWDFLKEQNIPAAIVTGNLGQLTVKTNFNPDGLSFRLRYISNGDTHTADAPLGAYIELPTFFAPMFEKGAAGECGDLIMTDRPELLAVLPEKRDSFKQEFLMYLARFKEWLRSSRSKKGITRRTASNAARRISRRYPHRDW